MIPKPLNEIEWSDIEALRDSGREEDDTIEFKASFSGGPDYLSFSDGQREKALKSIAREAIAFINGRGGDIIIGAEEDGNADARISALNMLPNITVVADRLAKALSAVIEPHQSVVGVRAIRNGPDDTGVIVVRAPQSLRAPHRLTKDRECYIRRGRESVPMPMDEIQDVSVLRRRTIDNRQSILLKQFDGMLEGKVRRHRLAPVRFHARVVFLPLVETQINFTDFFLHSLEHSMPKLFIGDKLQTFSSPFTYINSVWCPTLRGRYQSYVQQGDHRPQDMFISREIGVSGTLIFDFANRIDLTNRNNSSVDDATPVDLIIRFLAHSLFSIKQVIADFPQLQFGLLSVGIVSAGQMHLVWGEGGKAPLDEGFVPIDPFEISENRHIDEAFVQLQNDLFALIEHKPPHLLTFETAQ